MPSGYLLGLILTSHVAAVGCLFLSALDVVFAVSLTLAVTLHAHHCYQKHYKLQTDISGFMLHDGQWFLMPRGAAAPRAAEVLSGSRVTSWFISLSLRDLASGARHDFALFSDAADAQELRRLRVWLGLMGTTTTDAI